MAGPQTTREALLAELLGDAGLLLERAEQLRTDLPAVADQAVAKVCKASEQTTQDLAAAMARLSKEMVAEQGKLLHGTQAVARDAHGAAQVVSLQASRFAFLTLLTGFAGGIVGGVLGGLALSRYFFGM